MSSDDRAHAPRLFEGAADRTVYGVATACGLDRCNVADAQRAVTKMAEPTIEATAE